MLNISHHKHKVSGLNSQSLKLKLKQLKLKLTLEYVKYVIEFECRVAVAYSDADACVVAKDGVSYGIEPLGSALPAPRQAKHV